MRYAFSLALALAMVALPHSAEAAASFTVSTYSHRFYVAVHKSSPDAAAAASQDACDAAEPNPSCRLLISFAHGCWAIAQANDNPAVYGYAHRATPSAALKAAIGFCQKGGLACHVTIKSKICE